MIGANLMEAASTGKDPEPIGNASIAIAPHDCYPCKGEDRWCVIAAENEAQWTALAQLIGGESRQDQRFKTNAERLQNSAALNAIIAQWTQDQRCLCPARSITKAGIPGGGGANRRGSDQRSPTKTNAAS